MSGHSKWSQIKRQKGAADQKRGALFTKLANVITIAAREGGGGNPDSNFKLRLAIENAKSANMPKDNIEKAIKRGTGEIAGGKIEEIVYEGFGPSGIAVIIQCLTDNRNRTASTIKHVFTKYNGSLGRPNSVLWMFEKRGIIRIENHKEQIENLENIELELIDNGAIDITEDENDLVIISEPTDLQKLRTFLSKKDVNISYAEIEFLPKDAKELETKKQDKLAAFTDELDSAEDVNNVFHNAKS